MYRVQPKGINIRENERNVLDGFLQESINLQWKDGAFRPIPERLYSGISDNPVLMGQKIIAHKVSDEDQVNILTIGASGTLVWYGKIVDGEYTESPTIITEFPLITDFDTLSFTILNGLIYFMSSSQEFYYRLQYNETDEAYEVKDMYAWKSLIPYYPRHIDATGTQDLAGYNHYLCTRCGIILTRFTLVLKTGEEVLHSPIYVNHMYSINSSTTPIDKDDSLTNIHTIVNTNLEFLDTLVFDEEIASINVYASIPFYETKVREDASALFNTDTLIDSETIKGEIQRLSDSPFYLVKTLDNFSSSLKDKNVLFYAGTIDPDIGYDVYEFTNISKVNTDTIAAGQVMPVDNFTYHKIYGKITSNNGRLIIESPKTILSNGHIRSLSLSDSSSKQGFEIKTEDGDLRGIAYDIDKTPISTSAFGVTVDAMRGVLSYPDTRADKIGGVGTANTDLRLYKARANKAHNMSCVYDIYLVIATDPIIRFETVDSITRFTFTIDVSARPYYINPNETVSNPPTINPVFYTSENRFQFSEIGEFSVWPAVNSYRVGEGKIMFVGSNSVDPANTDYISPLLIGTSDGIYTANFDPTGANLIQSITRAANLPALSENNIAIDQNLIYVSDKGLIVINNGQVINITKDYFPEKGNGDFPPANDVYPNYYLLTQDIFDSGPNPYILTDIIDYMKGALFAYDGRRNNVWCSNPDKNFSLIYNLETKQWTKSTYVFTQIIDFNGIIKIDDDDIFSRYLIKRNSGSIDVLSGEDASQQVFVHLLTRPIKIQKPDQYKKIQRLISRCELYRDDSSGNLTFGLWGKQDLNKDKDNIPLIAYKDNSTEAFPDNIRQDIPVGRMLGKYKTITILQGGKLLPSSGLNSFEIVAIPVENNILR
jgi:hypothetical protein